VKFIKNAELIKILEDYQGPLVTHTAEIKQMLSDLSSMCHPQDQAAGNDLSTVLRRLDLIAAQVATLVPRPKKQKARKVSLGHFRRVRL